MARVYEEITEGVAEFVLAQPVFFVATVPRADDGHINLSPKGLAGSLAVVDEHTLAYLDLTGSGVETIAHLRENGRVVLMFCAFDGPPRIVRFHGRGEALLAGTPGFAALAGRFPEHAATRSIIRVAVDRVADSCGFGVPVMALERQRPELARWAAHQGPDGLDSYRATRNAASIDGLPGLSE